MNGAFDGLRGKDTEIVSEEQIYRAFAHRLCDQSGADALDRNAGLLRSPDGSILSPSRVCRLFIEFLTTDDSLQLPKSVAWHIYNYYLKDKVESIKSINQQLKARQDETDLLEQRSKLQNLLVAEMRDFIRDPSRYGIDPQTQHDRWSEISQREGFDYEEELKTNLFARLYDENDKEMRDENGNHLYAVLDPFHVNGRLPPYGAIDVACRRIIDEAFDSEEKESREGRRLLRDRLVGQLIGMLKGAMYPDRSLNITSRERDKNISKVLDQLATVMRQIIDQSHAQEYVNAIYSSDTPDGLVQLESVNRALPYQIEKMPENNSEAMAAKRAAIYEFYTALLDKYTEEEKAQLDQWLSADSNQFYKVGGCGMPKPDEKIYTDVLAVLRYRGLSEEDIKSMFIPMVFEVLQRQQVLRQKLNEEYRIGGATGRRNTQEINKLKQAIGEARKEFLKKAQVISSRPDLFRGIALPPVSDDPLKIIINGEVSLYTKEKEESGTIKFECQFIENQTERLATWDEIVKQLDKREDDAKFISNELSYNEDFIAAQERYQAAKKQFEKLITDGDNVTQEVIQEQLDNLVMLLGEYLEFYYEARREFEERRVADSVDLE